jgi:hypothetical protein
VIGMMELTTEDLSLIFFTLAGLRCTVESAFLASWSRLFPLSFLSAFLFSWPSVFPFLFPYKRFFAFKELFILFSHILSARRDIVALH